jgi:uroporphyrinogen-III decarboxylase
MFGVPLLFRSDREPWIDSPPLLEDKAVLDKLELPDFHTSGLMPQIHLFCNYAAEVLGNRIQVLFPTWARGPLATAMQLRGMQNLLVDMLEDPDFVHRLMHFVTAARKAWLKQRAEFLNQPIQPGLLFNDEIGAPLLHPGLYREFVLPYELELAEFHGGIFYFHSCGDTTLFLDDIAAIPGLQLFHVGPNTNLARVVERINPDVALDICMQDVRDIYETTDEQKRTKLTRIAELCAGRRYYVRADGFDVLTTPEADLGKIRRWCEIATEIKERR